MRSVVVVLPASMCAMMPMFRVFSRGTCRAISISRTTRIGAHVAPIQSKSDLMFRFPLLGPEPQNQLFCVIRSRRSLGKLVNYKSRISHEHEILHSTHRLPTT